MPDQAMPFDRRRLLRQRERASSGFARAAWLLDAALERLVERLADVRRDFPRALVLGGWDGRAARLLASCGKVKSVTTSDLAHGFARMAPAPALVADEEAWPFAPASFDLIASPLVLQWVNDLPGALAQARSALAPDGLFLGVLLGGSSLAELRHAWLEADLEDQGGAGPRVAPTLDLRDGAGLLQRAGFALPVADSERLDVTYASPLDLMTELKAMGLPHALEDHRKGMLKRRTLEAACAAYEALAQASGGRVRATFEFVFLSGWAPHPSQPKPLPRGSARASLATALGAVEQGADETP